MKAKAEQAAKVLDFFTQNGVELFNFSALRRLTTVKRDD